MEKHGLTFTGIAIITRGGPGARLWALGTPSYIQGESKVHVVLQKSTTMFLSAA